MRLVPARLFRLAVEPIKRPELRACQRSDGLSEEGGMNSNLCCSTFRVKDFFPFPGISFNTWTYDKIVMRRITLFWGRRAVEFWRVSVS